MNKDLKKLIEQFKNEYYHNSNLNDEKIFTLFCIKYFFYEESFAPNQAEEYVVDGANDGGIDAIFNDPNSDESDVVIIQSKFYKTTKLNVDSLIGDITKINSTIINYNNHNTDNLNKSLKNRLITVMDEKQNDGKIVIHYFTSYETKDKKEYNNFIKRIKDLNLDFEIELHFGINILDTVNLVESGNMSVPNAKIQIDKTDNYLEYEDSIIANVSAKSILDLYIQYKDKGLFAQNLRYYIKDKNVDKGIKTTLKEEPNNFWFYNNGLIIITEDMDISGKEIKLTNFSIINGGQTTSLIGMNGDIIRSLDIYIPVKIIKTGMKEFSEDEDFAAKVARASNAQKAIKAKDLISNRKEQIDLKSKLSGIGVFYELKRGEKRANKYKDFLYAKSDQVAKLVAAGILQIPGTTRSNTSKLYTETYYYKIFSYPAKAELVKDLLVLESYYIEYKKIRRNDFIMFEKKVSLMDNGLYLMISSIVLAISTQKGLIDQNIQKYWSNEEKRKEFLNPLNKIDKLIIRKSQDEREIIFEIFDILLDTITSRYEIYEGIKNGAGELVVASNFLKLDTNYYDSIAGHIFMVTYGNNKLKELISKVFTND